MTSEIETTELLSFCAALVRLAEDVAEAHRLAHILLDRAAEVREAIASLRGTARTVRPA